MDERGRSGSLVVRVALPDDLEGLFELALAAGPGMTNLQADRDVLAEKLQASAEAVASTEARDAGSPILFVVEQARLDGAKQVVGTACIFPRVGVTWPFFSYRITRQTRTSQALGKRVSHDILNLANDFDGGAEVGGLFVLPSVRGQAAGRLIARARYLFLASHRDWFGRQVISELRGYQDARGLSPVWESLGRRFFDMDFAQADRTNALTGNQFIADLGPKHPIYVKLLSEAAQAALGQPHDHGRPAMQLLLEEGFRFEGYVDIFDGGPTLFADINDLVAVKQSVASKVVRIDRGDPGENQLVCAGEGARFRCAKGSYQRTGDGIEISSVLADTLGVYTGDEVRHVPL
jgi:arginine N-succinyltransferase